MTYFSLSRAKIGTDIDEGDGLLVSVDGRIIAILTRLSADYHGEARGSWFVEAGFGLCANPPREPIKHLSQALLWLAVKMGRQPADLRNEVEEFERAFRSVKQSRSD